MTISIRRASAAGRIAFDRPTRTTPTSSTISALEMELAADDARDVEEVFDEPRLRAGVAVDAFEGPRRLIGAARDGLQKDLQPAEDRVERRAQLVRQRGEEFVFQAARPGQLVVGGRQPAVAALHLLDHAVERVDERPDFVVACLRARSV